MEKSKIQYKFSIEKGVCMTPQEHNKAINIKSLILDVFCMLFAAITIWVHPMFEAESVGALP